MVRPLKLVVAVAATLLSSTLSADTVPVKRLGGYLHGFLVVKSMDDRILGSGSLTQMPSENRITSTLSLLFKDGSVYRETAVYSQRRIFQLLTYRQVQKGPSFKTQQTIFFDTSTGHINIHYTGEHGKAETIDDTLSLPQDLANGILATLLTDVDPKAETTLSMLVFTPKPRIVKLKIATSEQDTFFVGGASANANHYVVKFDLGPLTGTVAKVIGKQPPPLHVWVSLENTPVFLKLEGALFENGPIWRIELASPTWPKTAGKP